MSLTLNIHASLITRCKAFDPQAQLEIYQLYAKAMLNTAYRIVGTREDAEDILQEAFVSAFSNIDSYREEATFGAWLKRIVINKALTHLRKNREMESIEENFEVPDVQVELPEGGLSVEVVREAIMQLPAGFRTVLSMYLLEGYDHIEISEILNISVSTSKTQYMRARLRLKELLQKQLQYERAN